MQVTDAPQFLRVRRGGVDGTQQDGVIGSDPGGLVHRMRVAALEQDVGFCAHDEEGRAERKDVKALEIYVLVAIVKKRLNLEGSLYRILQILSVSVFEKTPLLEALSDIDFKDLEPDCSNQLTLFE